MAIYGHDSDMYKINDNDDALKDIQTLKYIVFHTILCTTALRYPFP